MDRFFSKLDLRDIKISPEGSSFPPDAAESEDVDTAASEYVAAPEEVYVESPVTAYAEVVPEPLVPTGVAWDSPVHHPQVAAEIYVNGTVDAPDVETAVVHSNGDILKVSAKSRPSAVAGAIAGVVREAGRAEVQAIGAGATNQAVKAVAIARDYLLETGIDAVCLPAFIDVTIDNEDRTAIRLVIEPR